MNVTPSSRTSSSFPGRVERPRVMVVMEDAAGRAHLQAGLGREGFEVSAVSDVAQAEQVLATGHVPAVVLAEATVSAEALLSFSQRLAPRAHLPGTPVYLLGAATPELVEAVATASGGACAMPASLPQGDVGALIRLDLASQRHHVAALETAVVPVDRLVRGLLAAGRPARLVLAGGRSELVVGAGRLLKATFDRSWGLDALVRALALTSGRYQVSLEPVKMVPEFHCGLREFEQVVLPRLAKWERTLQRAVPLDAHLQVDFQRLVAVLPTMPDELNRLTQLCDGRRSVVDVVADSPFEEVVSLEAVTRLYLLGVLSPASAKDEELVLPKGMPRLFEPQQREAQELMERLFGGTGEIRHDEAAPVEMYEDWYQPSRGTGLEVVDPSEGWRSAPMAEAAPELREELDRALSLQIEAFNVKAEVEPREQTAAEKPVAAFSAGQMDPRGPDASLDDVVAAAVAASAVVTEPVAPAEVPAVVLERLTARSVTPPMVPVIHPDAQHSSRHVQVDQRRINTPVMMPAVTVSATAPAPRPSLERLARAFFSMGEAPVVVDPTLVTRPEADQPERAPRGVRRSPTVLIVAAVAVVAVGVGVLFESMQQVPSRVPAKPAPALSKPMAAKLAAPVEAEPSIETTIDVTEPLADATKAYELGQYRKAVSMLEQVTTDAPANVQAWLMLGLARYDFGNSAGARSATEKALELDAKNPRAWILLSAIQQDAADKEGAHASLQKAIDADPTGPFADEARALLR